ncbi:hypothetical protein ACFU51_26020 [Streptomyces sp. NPDC057430]|uniref:hypothetical protein n=1 Tax=unclassified Streptomyces TaxID=2593676 RepID=UPI003675366E
MGRTTSLPPEPYAGPDRAGTVPAGSGVSTPRTSSSGQRAAPEAALLPRSSGSAA